MKAPQTTLALIAFDLDDTLYPEIAFVKSGFKAVACTIEEKFALPNNFYNLLWSIFQEGERKKTFDKALERAGLPVSAQTVHDMVAIYRTHMPDIMLYPDAREILEYLQGRKKIGLITDGYLATQKNKFKALQIESYFDLSIFTDEIGREGWKPSTWGYQRIMRHFTLQGAQCAYVGDNSLKDFAGAKSLKWLTFRIERDDGFYRNSAEGYENTSDYTVRSLVDLKELIS
jgi:putative hydrolase of the HAD superfamily